MKKPRLQIRLFIISFFMFIPVAFSQDVGATFCWQYQEIYGGHRSYLYNKSIVTDNLPTSTTPEWVGMTQWWENMAEEIDYSGIDFIALLSRGDQPNAPDRGNGNPTHISKMVNAMNTRGSSFKLAIFDDCPNSWTGSKNWDQSGGADYNTTSPKFDCANSANYKYIWDYNLRPAITAIPDAKRYKIDGRMVIFFWSVKPTWMSNTQGNLTKILAHIRSKCQTEFGFVPYIIIDKDWLPNDTTLSTTNVDAVHGWFNVAQNVSYTLETWNGKKTGALCPGFGKPTETADYLDPSMGTSDNGKRLKTGLTATVDAGARTTLVEGFTDSAEGAALWRSKDPEYYDYPNQRLNILRRYSSDPYPSILKMEAEACDFNSDATSTNSGGTFLKTGNLDVEKCSDQYSGWNVTDTQANEWMEWRELPLLKETKFKLRYKSTAVSSIKFSVDGTALATISLPSTAGVWTSVDAGTYSTASNSLHTVKLTVVSGSPDINYFTRENNDNILVSSVSVSPATATLADGATQQLTASVAPSNATDKAVTWSSSNTAVATVNGSGLVTAVNPGTATITVTTQDGAKTDTSLITVTGLSNVMQNLQAESATYVGAILATNQTGYKGTGFVDFVNDTDDYIQWSVNVPTAGTYELSFRYALPNGGRPLELKVNGTVKIASFDFPATGLWNTWLNVSTSQTLNAGNNTIRLTTIGSNGGNIDLLSIAPYLDTCDALTSWGSASANTLTATTTNKKQGTGSVQMVGSGTEEFKKVFSPAFNSGTTISNGVLNFWYFVSDVTKTGTVIIELGSGGAADVNELSWSLTGLVNGWNEISLPFSTANQAGTVNLNAINWFRLFSPKTASITTRIDAIQVLNSATVASAQRKGIKGDSALAVDADQTEKSITVYPNPYKGGTLSVDITGFEASNEVQLKVTNLLGQLIHQEIVTDTKHKELNLSGRLNEAVYFISIEDGENKLVKKLIVK